MSLCRISSRVGLEPVFVSFLNNYYGYNEDVTRDCAVFLGVDNDNDLAP